MINRLKNLIWTNRPAFFSVEAGRIGLGLMYVYILLVKDIPVFDPEFYAKNDPEVYAPIGPLLSLLFPEAPDLWVMQLMYFTVVLTSIGLIFGIFSRWSLVLSLLSNLLLQSFMESFTLNWSHHFNVVFLAHLAFVFAPVGRTWSWDAWIKKKRGIPRPQTASGFYWVWLAQAATALMFFDACYWKVFGHYGYFTLEWANSDNMRNCILISTRYLGDAIPERTVWIANNEWAYKGIAWSNILFQGLPILALFSSRWPWFRLLLGLLFVGEDIGLGFVMRLHFHQFIFLFVFFVDWDYFLKKYRKIQLPKVELKSPKIHYWMYGLIFLSVYIYIAFGFIDKTGKNHMGWNTYPFTQFKMYSALINSKDGESFKRLNTFHEVSGDLPKDSLEYIGNRLLRHYNWIYWHERDPERYQEVQASMLTKLHGDTSWCGIFNGDKVEEIRSYRSVVEFVQYPEPADVRVLYKGLSGIYTPEHFYFGFCYAQGSKKEGYRYYLQLLHRGYEQPQFTFSYRKDFGAEVPLEGLLEDDRFYYNLDEPGTYSFFMTISDSTLQRSDHFMGDHRVN